MHCLSLTACVLQTHEHLAFSSPLFVLNLFCCLIFDYHSLILLDSQRWIESRFAHWWHAVGQTHTPPCLQTHGYESSRRITQVQETKNARMCRMDEGREKRIPMSSVEERTPADAYRHLDMNHLEQLLEKKETKSARKKSFALNQAEKSRMKEKTRWIWMWEEKWKGYTGVMTRKDNVVKREREITVQIHSKEKLRVILSSEWGKKGWWWWWWWWGWEWCLFPLSLRFLPLGFRMIITDGVFSMDGDVASLKVSFPFPLLCCSSFSLLSSSLFLCSSSIVGILSSLCSSLIPFRYCSFFSSSLLHFFTLWSVSWPRTSMSVHHFHLLSFLSQAHFRTFSLLFFVFFALPGYLWPGWPIWLHRLCGWQPCNWVFRQDGKVRWQRLR